MASGKPRSVWTLLERLGHRGDRDDIIQRVFEAASRVTVRSGDGEPMDGDAFLVETFEALGTSKTWPPCGSPEWVRLRNVALERVVARLAREGLLDCLGVGPVADAEGERKPHTAENENPDPREGVQVGRAMIRRARRNREGWSRCVERDTPYRLIVRWAAACCQDVSRENLVALADEMRGVAWVDEDGHLLGGVMLAAMESELAADWHDEEWVAKVANEEQWVDVVAEFETAIEQLRSVFTRLSLL